MGGAMKVLGHEVSEAQVEAVVVALSRRGQPFTFMTFIGALRRVGVDMAIADRAADRALQKLRKAGRAKFIKGYWHFTPSPTESGTADP